MSAPVEQPLRPWPSIDSMATMVRCSTLYNALIVACDKSALILRGGSPRERSRVKRNRAAPLAATQHTLHSNVCNLKIRDSQSLTLSGPSPHRDHSAVT